MMNNLFDIPVDEFASPIKGHANRNTKFGDLEEMMENNGFRHLPVLEDKVPVGMISKRDLALLKNNALAEDLVAEDLMVKDPYCIRQGASIEEAAFEMSSRKIGSAIVLNAKGEADSIFTSIDGLNALIEVVRGDYNK